MESSTSIINIRKSEMTLQYSVAYLRKREIAKDKMTEEQRENENAKNRANDEHKTEKFRVKRIADMTAEEKEKKRVSWKKSTRKYRSKRTLGNIRREKQLQGEESGDQSAADHKVTMQEDEEMIVRDEANPHNEIEELSKRINQTKRKLEYLKKKSHKNGAKKKPGLTIPDSKVGQQGSEDMYKDIQIPSQMHHNDMFGEFLQSKLQVKADALLKSCKTGEVFEICDIEFASMEQNMLDMVINILPTEENSNITILNSDVKSDEIVRFFERPNDGQARRIKINCLRKIIC